MLPEVLDMLRILSRTGTPAMRARGRILLKRLEAEGGEIGEEAARRHRRPGKRCRRLRYG